MKLHACMPLTIPLRVQVTCNPCQGKLESLSQSCHRCTHTLLNVTLSFTAINRAVHTCTTWWHKRFWPLGLTSLSASTLYDMSEKFQDFWCPAPFSWAPLVEACLRQEFSHAIVYNHSKQPHFSIDFISSTGSMPAKYVCYTCDTQWSYSNSAGSSSPGHEVKQRKSDRVVTVPRF